MMAAADLIYPVNITVRDDLAGFMLRCTTLMLLLPVVPE